jgi:hypothetical protein
MAAQIELKNGKVYSSRAEQPYNLTSEENVIAFIQAEQLPILLSPRISDLVEHRFPTDNLDRAILKTIESIEKEEGRKITDIPHNIQDLRKILFTFCEQLNQYQGEVFNLSRPRSG